MEKLYKKLKNGRYESVGYSGVDISDGVWLVQSNEFSKSYTSLLWKLSDLKRPVDVTTQAAMFSIADDLANYLYNLGEVDSGEYVHAKEFLAGYLSGAVQINNISMQDLSSLILKFIANKIEK